MDEWMSVLMETSSKNTMKNVFCVTNNFMIWLLCVVPQRIIPYVKYGYTNV